ncbi:sulfatase-like hydrolase/transferase [Zooshikella ganghwensis]|uniref:sulfatase-like hydrolase/transferase n=1 Tax=Zooshikella ganghwensis TaxID=202772 RepID=UPI000406A390|nr:sulfatase-like hydrolase/transferase [Zooshikella ganghwensis]
MSICKKLLIYTLYLLSFIWINYLNLPQKVESGDISFLPLIAPASRFILTLLLIQAVIFITSFLVSSKYPLTISAFISLTLVLINQNIFPYNNIFTLSTIITIVFIISSLLIEKNYKNKYKLKVNKIAFALPLLAISVLLFSSNSSLQKKQKNIVIIGIDALRPDFLGINDTQPSITPNIDKFLTNSTFYTDVTTPLARTYPAWVSILTGLYGTNTHARFNLMPKGMVDRQHNLQNTLKEKGYTTIYAIDERRFNNIDETYGFDYVVGPKIGAADFVLASISDIPIVNLTCLTSAGEYIFPYSCNNRAKYSTYIPENFVDSVVRTVKANTGKPLFISTHFTLPHWPFRYSQLEIPEGRKFDEKKPNHFFYMAMLQAVDKQFQYFIEQLKNTGVLDNALVIVLSDHGEGFMLDQDKLKKGIDGVSFKTNAMGHGTNILSLEQYQVVLGIQKFGKSNQSIVKTTPVSLIDIAPTIYDYLNITPGYKPEGKALNWQEGGIEEDSERFLFIESSLSVESMNSSRLDAIKVMMQGIHYYTTTKEGLVTIKPELINETIAAKQRGVIHKDWLLAMFPDMTDNMIIVNRKAKTWWPLTHYKEEKMAPWREMLSALCTHYKNDAGFDKYQLCQKFSGS